MSQKDDVKNYWLKMYQEDKIGTIAKLSQAMQHEAWLREWRRVHGDSPRIKPITEKINGEKVKVGESNIAVHWSELDEFFKVGNEYGDVETVKFLAERIESGDVSALTEQELHDLSERENVKWSDGKHSLNPFQGYLYDFTAKNSFTLDPAEREDEYGKFYPAYEYIWAGESWQGLEDFRPNDSEHAIRSNQTHLAFQRYYTTRLMQELIKIQGANAKYRDFVDFDITSVTTPEQITELDKKLAEIAQSFEIRAQLEVIDENKEYEKAFYDKLREEVAIEIKKDSDRIENAHKVFVALETGNLDEILQDPETQKWAIEVYDIELIKKVKDEILNGDSEIGYVQSKTDDYSFNGKGQNEPESISRPMPRKVFELGKKLGIGFPTDIRHVKEVYSGSESVYENDFIQVEECSEEQKNEISKRMKKVEKYRTKVEGTKDGRYDKAGILYLPVYKTNNMAYAPGNRDVHPEAMVSDTIEIEVTQRELAGAGILPEDFKWMELARVSPKDIADADREQALTTTEVGGVKGFMKKLLDKFKGKGEK